MGGSSEQEAEKTRRVSTEILSDDEGTETEGRGNSSDRTDIVADSPATNPSEIPTGQPSRPKSPPPKDQPTIAPSDQDQIQPSKPIEEEPLVESQPQQPPDKIVSAASVVASEATTADAEDEQSKVPTKKMRVKHVMTRFPFEKRKQGGTYVMPEAGSEQADANLELQMPKNAEPIRAKLQVRRKKSVSRGKPATATSSAFAAPRHVEPAAGSAEEVGVAVFKDAIASEELEVENAQPNPAVAI